MKVVCESRMAWMLFQEEDNYFLSVVCGSVGIFTRDVNLTPFDIENYSKNGQSFIDELSKEIQNNPSEYEGRIIKDFRKNPEVGLAAKEWRANLENRP